MNLLGLMVRCIITSQSISLVFWATTRFDVIYELAQVKCENCRCCCTFDAHRPIHASSRKSNDKSHWEIGVSDFLSSFLTYLTPAVRFIAPSRHRELVNKDDFNHLVFKVAHDCSCLHHLSVRIFCQSLRYGSWKLSVAHFVLSSQGLSDCGFRKIW